MADANRKGTPRKGTPRTGASRPGAGGPGLGRGSARPGSSRPVAKASRQQQRPRAAAKAPRLSAPKPAAGPRKPAARPSARSSAPRQGSSSRAPRPSGAKGFQLSLKNPFAGVKSAAAAPTPPVAGARPSFLDRAAAGGPVPTGKERREQHQREGALRFAGGIVAVVCALGLVALVAFFVLRDSAIFSVDDVVVEATAHVSESDISNLLSVSSGTTLLNVDRAQIEAQLKRDPWVESVNVERQFPHTLKLTVTEQSVQALVVMNASSIGWYLSSSGSWIEPVKISASDGQSVADAALALARAEGVLLITGVPATCDPVAGAEATDDVLLAVKSFQEGFSQDFSSKIVSYEASSADAVSCVLTSGVQVSLGSATNISYKEQVAAALIEKYPGQITYINVRVPSSASVRRISSDDVTQGSGASAGSGSAEDDGSGSAGASAGDGSSGDGADDASAADDGSAATDGEASPEAAGESGE